uniref:Uncharacterized protein n=1 Tax=Panagrolaimus sp. PS1159 TaxID=55785 RepID=A0AC35EWG3_9BILA
MIFFPDHWISIEDERNYKTKTSEDNKGFSLIDTKEETYLKIAKLLQPNLQDFEMEELLSMKFLKVLPQNLIVSNPEKLLNKLEEIEAAGYFVRTEAKGMLYIKNCLELSASQVLNIKDMEMFIKLITLIENLQNLLKANGRRRWNYMLQYNGLFSDEGEKADRLTEVFNSESGIKAVEALFEDKENIGISFTFDSIGRLMIGNFLWITISEYAQYLTKFCEIAVAYEAAIKVPEYDLMRSIHDLPDIEQAIFISRKLNPLLLRISDTILKQKIFKCFPTDLYHLWKKNSPEINQHLTKAFLKLSNRNVTWFFNLQGFLRPSISLTVTHLLKIKNFDALIELKNIKDWMSSNPILCEEEIKNGMYQNVKIYKTKLSSYEDIIKAKNEADNIFKNRNRIEPNGTLLFNKNLWIKPKEFLENVEKFKAISKYIEEMF